MIDPLISLAFTLNSSKGVYGLLVGSGVSRTSGIPTGWEVVLDLIRKVAKLYDEEVVGDGPTWYKNRFGKEVNYSDLLNELAKTPSERQQLLKGYFEPTKEDVENNLKVPTEAHKNIAKLVANSSVKLIITTNFDRLIEKALEEVNIIPNVISTTDEIKGALPLTHSHCTILKVNGDYLDTRIKNTQGELEKYDKELDNLLDRIFDEFGIIVCGWSADWDIALRTALLRTPNRRFSLYWSALGDLTQQAQKIIEFRGGIVLKGYDADTFFFQLAEKVEALEHVDRKHPISLKVAIANAKKYLSNDTFYINLHDLILEEAVRVAKHISEKNFPVNHIDVNDNLIRNRISKYETICEILNGLFINLCYWGNEAHKNILVKSFDVVANPEDGRAGGYKVLFYLKMYPALLLLYSGGIASIANSKYDFFVALLTQTHIFENGHQFSAVNRLHAYSAMPKEVAAILPGRKKENFTPLSDYLYDILRPYFIDILPHDIQYEQAFDRFEYLLSLVYADVNSKGEDRFWAPMGSFGWRGIRYHLDRHVSKLVDLEIENMGEEWPLLRFNLFDKSVDRLREVKKLFDEFLLRHHWG